jgi:hypothetical protein
MLCNKRLWNNRGFCLGSPECRLKPQLVYALDKHADVMAKHLAQNLIDLSNWSLGPDRTPELCLYHGEGGLDIRPLVVMLQESIPIEVVEVPHPVPQPVKLVMVVSHASGVGLKGDKSRSALSLNRPQVLPAGVGFVCGNLVDIESLCSPAHQSRELQIVSRLVGSGFDTGDDVGFDATNQVGFDPSLLTALLAILVVEPSVIYRCRKAGGINGEVGLYRPERASALLDEGLEQGRQFGVLQIAEGAGERRGLCDQSLSLRFPQVGHEAPAGHCGVDLAGDTEHDIGQRQSRSPEPVFGLGYAVAEVSEQGDKPLLLVGLCLVVDRPVLGIGHPHCFGHDFRAVGALLPLDDELDGIDMLAFLVCGLKMVAGAKRLAVVHIHDVSPVAGLGRDFPSQPVFLDCVGIRYRQSSFLPNFHFLAPIHSLFCIYNSTLCVPLSRVFRPILPKYPKFPIDNSIYCVLLCLVMNEIQDKIAQLQDKGWTLAAIADSDELGGVHRNTVGMWKAGTRYPRPDKPILDALDHLLKRNRIPKKKRYAKGSRRR